jgi:hypothetical protein
MEVELEEIGHAGVRIHLDEDEVQWPTFMSTIMNLRVQ